MPSKDPVQRFEDILQNIELIEGFTTGLNRTTFTQDARTTNAVERCLERISEAAKKLSGVAETLCPEIPWPKVRALGNFLRHEYDTVDVVRVWLMVEDDLPSLKAAALAALERLRQQPGEEQDTR